MDDQVQNAGQERRILIVEDDNTFRRLLARTLATQGFKTREAESGLAAKTFFDNEGETYCAIISDVRMPEMDGSELLKYIRSKSQIPFIVMTGYSEIMDTTKAFELGANDFVPKPFRIDILLGALQRCLDVVDKLQKPQEKPVFCPIHIDEFISATKLLSDIYIKLHADHFIRVAHKGEEVPVERMRTYKDKQVDYLYVHLSDFNAYVTFSVQLAAAVTKNSGLDREKKIKLLTHTTSILVEQCFLGSLTKENVRPAQSLVESTMRLLLEDSDILELFTSLADRADRMYSHGVAVALFSAMAAKEYGWNSTSTLFKIVVAALFHDIGKREIDETVLTKRRLHRSRAETKLYESHAARGRDIVRQIQSLPEDIAQIVHQHHETPNGMGFPLQIRGEALHPLARLIGTIDAFVERTMPMSPEQRPESPEVALAWLRNEGFDMVDLHFVAQLEKIFNVNPATNSLRAA